MDLFSYGEERRPAAQLLADRARPRTLEEYIGQEHIVGSGRLLRRAIEMDKVPSILLYGPPGCGKTTLAGVISEQTKGEFVPLNAVDVSVKDVRAVIEQANTRKKMYNTKTILFLDEVHRFNHLQQDALLPAIEKGTIIFIGATTENPFHHVNRALMSRATLFQLKPLTKDHALIAMKRALANPDRGLGFVPIRADANALEHIAMAANGDIRRALNALEMAAMTTIPEKDGTVHITLEVAEESVRCPIAPVDEFVQYDMLSAFHKSIRGSSDAALFWFLYAVEKLGMDPMPFIRRLTVACSEDIGLANPQAMVQAVNALEAYHRIGWPESKYMIAQAILFAIESPKSNSIPLAIRRVMQACEEMKLVDVPLHLRDTHDKGADNLRCKGYQYPHDYPGHYVEQQYLPDPIKKRVFFMANEQGIEAKMRANQQRRKDSHQHGNM